MGTAFHVSHSYCVDGEMLTTSLAQNQPDFNSVDCPIDCDAVIGTPSRPSTLPPTERPPTDNDSDGALGLTAGLAAAAVAVAAAF